MLYNLSPIIVVLGFEVDEEVQIFWKKSEARIQEIIKSSMAGTTQTDPISDIFSIIKRNETAVYIDSEL